MRHFAAFCIKLGTVTFLLLIMLTGVYNYPTLETIMLSVVIVGVSYLLGDLGILRMSNNLIASIADVGLTAVVIWLLGPLFYGTGVPFMVAILSGLVIGCCEYIFHIYFANQVLQKGTDPSPQS